MCGQDYRYDAPSRQASIVLSDRQIQALRTLSGRNASGRSALVRNFWSENNLPAGEAFLDWNKDMPSRHLAHKLIIDWATGGQIQSVLEIAFGGLHEYRAMRRTTERVECFLLRHRLGRTFRRSRPKGIPGVPLDARRHRPRFEQRGSRRRLFSAHAGTHSRAGAGVFEYVKSGPQKAHQYILHSPEAVSQLRGCELGEISSISQYLQHRPHRDDLPDHELHFANGSHSKKIPSCRALALARTWCSFVKGNPRERADSDRLHPPFQ